jgi:hypothetical protein
MAMNSKPDKPGRTDTIPTEGYVLTVDGKMKTKYAAAEDAAAAAQKLKQAYPVIQVKVFDAAARTYTPVLLTDAAAKSEG